MKKNCQRARSGRGCIAHANCRRGGRTGPRNHPGAEGGRTLSKETTKREGVTGAGKEPASGDKSGSPSSRYGLKESQNFDFKWRGGNAKERGGNPKRHLWRETKGQRPRLLPDRKAQSKGQSLGISCCCSELMARILKKQKRKRCLAMKESKK